MQGPAFFSAKGEEAKSQEEVLQCVMVPIPRQKFLKYGKLSFKYAPKKWEKLFLGCFRHTLVFYKKGKDELATGAVSLVGSTIVFGTKEGKKVIEISSPLAFVLRGSERDEFRGKQFFLTSKDDIDLNEWHQLLTKQNNPAPKRREESLAPLTSQHAENSWVMDSTLHQPEVGSTYTTYEPPPISYESTIDAAHHQQFLDELDRELEKPLDVEVTSVVQKDKDEGYTSTTNVHSHNDYTI